MKNPYNQNNFSFSSCDFYLSEMRRAIEMFDAGETAKLGYPIFSFFHGKTTDSTMTPVDTGHVFIFLEQPMQKYLECDPYLFTRWVEVIYGYFWIMAATPVLAREIWVPLWVTLEVFEKAGIDTLQARCQMGSWAASYDEEKKSTALDYIKSMNLVTPHEKALRSLFLSTKINEDAADYLEQVNRAYLLSPYLPPIHRLQANIHYFCKVATSRKLLTDILSILNWVELSEYRKGKMEMLAPLYWTLVHHNKYEDLLFFARCLKGRVDTSNFDLPHAFLLPNSGACFPALTKSELVTFVDQDNGKSYTNLIKLCNRLNKVAISLLGDEEVDFQIDETRFGTPSHDANFEELRHAVISHYHLSDSFYQELQLISLLPSHNHPLQGALCTLGIVPPLISVSFENLAEEPAERVFIFFLSSETYTHDLEEEWIRKEFGEDAEVFTDPPFEFFISSLNNERYTHVYISAHGVYDHWQYGGKSIHFSAESQILVFALKTIKRTTTIRRTIVLNICDGATSPLSFNHNNRGLAASLASGNQVVISHLWPVQPLYAGVFGMLVMKELTTKTSAEAVLSTCRVLNQPNNLDVARSTEKMAASFNVVASTIAKATFNFSDFRNLGSMAIYA